MHYALLGRAIDTVYVIRGCGKGRHAERGGVPLVSQATPLRLKGIICVACETRVKALRTCGLPLLYPSGRCFWCRCIGYSRLFSMSVVPEHRSGFN